MSTIVDLFAQRLSRDPAQPFVTVVSDEGRVELSAVTLGSWQQKTAGLLRDDVAAAWGDEVSVRLPLGWQSLAWQLAVWRAGMTVAFDSSRATVEVIDEQAQPTSSADVVVVGRHPLGMPSATPLTVGIEWSTSARVMPDRFTGPGPAATDLAVRDESRAFTHAELTTHATELAALWGVGSGTRFLLDAAHQPVDAWLGSCIVPIITGGSIVLWTATAAPKGMNLEAERVEVVVR